MEKKILISLLCFMLLLPVANAQSLKSLSIHDDPNPIPIDDTTPHKEVPDTAYCVLTKKQHGWYAPFQTISKKHAEHMSRVIRFTQRNAYGHWLKMEIINARGEYTSSPFSPYIYQLGAEDTDPTANEEWSSRLKDRCIYEMIPDPTGMNVIQERAYDRDYNLVFSFSRTPVAPDSLGHQRYVGSYRDFYGLPAEMRDDPHYTYGTLVMITEDQWGNDSIIQFMDAKGVPKPNGDGVSMSRIIYNQAGLPVKNQSCDAQGNPIIDNWGNCGYINAYNDDGLEEYATYIDEKDQPMPMPGLRTDKEKSEGVIRKNYMYDKWGRLIRETFTLADGTTPGANAQGAHRIDHYPDEWGNDTLVASYDMLNNPVAYDGDGCVKTHYRYNERGQMVALWGEDSLGRTFANPGYYCRMEWEYDSQGNECAHRYYTFRDGEERLADQDYTRREGNCIYSPYKVSGQRVDSLDYQGRLLTQTYYIDSCMLDTSEWAKMIVQYEDKERRCIQRTTYLDCNGRPCADEGVALETVVIDSVHWSKGYLKRDSLGNIVEAFVKHFTPHWEKWVGQSDINESGIICRAGGSGGVRLYRADILWDPQEDSYTLVGRDEFNEPDYIDDEGDLYYYRKKTKTGWVKYDEDNDKTSSYKVNEWLPKVPSVEVIDSKGYRLGLKDNDIILSYGDYTADPQTRNIKLAGYRSKWTLGSILNAEREKRVVVFRIDPDTKKYDLIELTLPPGTPSQLGFVTHVRYLTRRQMDRIKKCVETSPLLSNEDLDRGNTYTGEHSIIAAYPELRLSTRKRLRDKQMMDPAVLVGACTPDYGLTWIASDLAQSTIEEIANNRLDDEESNPEAHFFLTNNLRQTCSFSFREETCGVGLAYIRVNDSIYDQLCEIATRVKADINSLNVNTLKRKTLCGLWRASETVAHSTHDEDYPGSPYTCDVELWLKKDGRFQLDYHTQINPYCYSGYRFSDENWAYADLDVQGEYTGNWHPAGRSIVLEYADTICQNFRLLSAYDGNGNPSVDVHFVRNCLNGFAKDKDEFLNKTLPGAMLAKYHTLLLCTEDSFVLDRTGTPNPVFHKVEAPKHKRKSGKTDGQSSLYNGLTGTWRFPIWDDYSIGTTIVRLKSDHALNLSSSFHYGDGNLAFNCKMQVDGWWEQKGPRLTLSYPDSLVEYTIENIECSYMEDGVEEYVLSKKKILHNIAFDTEETDFDTTIRSLDGDTLVIAGEGLTGILTRCEDNAQAIAYILPRSPEQLSISGNLNGHDYVDLGLSVKWASCYLGAESPTNYGNYYQWGALAPKTSARDVSPANGSDVKDIAGNVSYDAARNQWGDTWRMPTQAELVELERSCIWKWTVLDHVQGYVVIGPNGNSIFLSAAGIYTSNSPVYVGTSCSLWSSTPAKADPNEAYNLHFWKAGQHVQPYERDRGHMIRPVCP